MKINNKNMVGAAGWHKPVVAFGDDATGEPDDGSVLRAAALLIILRHLQVMLIDNDPRVVYAVREDLNDSESEVTLMVKSVFGDEVVLDTDAVIQALEVCIDEPGEDIAVLWNAEIAKLALILEKADMKETGDWSYTDVNGLTLSFSAKKQMMQTNDESGDALLTLANII